MNIDEQTVLTQSVESVRAARRFVRLFLADPVPVAVAESAVLLASELVANAVVHSGAPDPAVAVVLRVESTPTRVRIEVGDHGDMLPVVQSGDVDSGSGRGLTLVDALSSRWGASVHDGGKTVWFEIDL